MPRFLPAFLLVLPVSVAVAAPVPKVLKKGNPDGTAILGTWRMFDHAMDGNRHDSSDVCYRFEPDGKLFCVHTNTGKEYPMAYELDPSGDPKKMEWKPTASDTAWPSIYKLDGDKLYLVCPRSKDGPRPTEIAAVKGVYYTEFRRESPAAK